jgi:hypothetical protein
VRVELEASEAISLVSNPSFSKVSIKICCAASIGGAIIVDDTKALTLAGWKKWKEEETGVHRQFCLFKVPPCTSQTSHRLTPQSSHRGRESDLQYISFIFK